MEESYTFSQHYEEKIRPCIDIVDNLRSLGVEKDLALPAIAVIGDQSSGKSSVLEALSGVALPRGSGIVTRCPLELKMIRTKEKGWHGKISYQTSNQDYCEDIDDPEDVEKKIREAQDKIAGPGVSISEDLISLQITSPNVPDLTLIDLPGIARVAVKGQPENIGEQIKRLIKKFVTKQETINLVVVPCNVDIATTEALQIAQNEDPEGERTLGILTKPDLVDKGTEQTVVDIVHNEVIHLTKGYMIVRCRGQKEIMDHVTLNEATETEKFFFKDHPQFNTLYNEGFATIPKLAEKLTIELVHHIEKSMPQLEEQIEAKLAETLKELEAYGTGPPSDPSVRLSFLIDKVTAFTQDMFNLTTGEEVICNSDLMIFQELRDEFAQWNVFLDSSGDNFNKKIEKEVDNFEAKYRGRELPGFINYKTFEKLVREQIKTLEEPALRTLKAVSDMGRKRFIQLAQKSFIGFPNLLKIAKTNIEAIKQEKESLAESMLRTQFKMELIVYSQDVTYSQSLQQTKVMHEEQTAELQSPLSELQFPLSVTTPQPSTSFTFRSGFGTDNHASLHEMKLHMKSYYSIASKRLADQIPMVIRFQLLQEAAAELQRNMLQLLQEKDAVDDLLKEDHDIGQKRETLISRQKRLLKARNLISVF
ncbi:interferon-induced GTP-binding protein MxB-like [Triplophysa dalaica]|uniref:interferon-induced GTP-binding protein MxB-like n=1 Tax=Triplophysa dalaica TaxID=1582913 RepID=UPI0024E03D7B|nr:interferon-induced GTP-binding protein MxB-like [Triplophysa dalaica]XP_056588127.1 interferon-induced GTP-binding protein MxB-like [Triplophysa dalaica]XP_056588128.1 interferon-induced GTP-binding protein MxB-like [Triplophysa dalaica]XP_056588129.1 interferon-induced GTP-binding protein MxB-like [Triplophysa dalaica]